MKRRNNIESQMSLGFPISKPSEPVPAKAKFEPSENGTVYVSYPQGTVGARIPCLFCNHAQVEAISKARGGASTYRFSCLLKDVVFVNPTQTIPGSCPRKNK